MALLEFERTQKELEREIEKKKLNEEGKFKCFILKKKIKKNKKLKKKII